MYNSGNQILDDFLSNMHTEENLSDETIKDYGGSLISYLQYLKKEKYKLETAEDKVDILDIDKELLNSQRKKHLRKYLEHLQNDKNNSEGTRSKKVSAIKKFFAYLYDEEYIDNNPAYSLKKPRLPKRQPVYLELNETETLLESIDGDYKVRDYAIISLFLNGGLRISELINVDIDHFKGDILRVIGKGNKERDVSINEACFEAINNYLKVRPNVDGKALFISEKKNRISKKAVSNLVQKHIEAAGLDSEKYTCHKLRSTCATLMSEHGKIPLEQIRDVLGHENVQTTLFYVGVNKDLLRNATKSNPLNRKFQVSP